MWTLNQLFPPCPVPTCPHFTTRHMLSHQEEVATQILTGEENYIYLQGGVGSAKTMLFAALGAALAISIPGSKGILFRKDYELNNETLWGFFLDSIESAFAQGILQGSYKKCLSIKKVGKHTQCLLPNGSFYKSGETKNLSRVMGPSYDCIIVSDAMENENFGYIFHGEGTVGGLQSRLRGQKSSFFKLPDGSYKDLRRFLIETNPPPNVNELHSIFGSEPGVRELTQPDPITHKSITYRHIQMEAKQNTHNPPSYIAEISSQHSDPNDIKRILSGKTIPYYGGVKVIRTFYPEIHVSSFETDKDLPLLVAIDTGIQHPAATFSQIKRCSFDKEHFITLSEISNLYDKTIEQFTTFNQQHLLGILPHLALFYPSYFDYTAYTQVRDHLLANAIEGRLNYQILQEHFRTIRFAIDKSANKRSEIDRESSRSVLLNKFGISTRYRTNIGLSRSLSRVNESFEEICICNIPVQLVDRKCQLLIDAYSGGYRYQKHKDGSHSNEPIQDHKYEDIADSHRYSIENFFFIQALDTQSEELFPNFTKPPWRWMEEGV